MKNEKTKKKRDLKKKMQYVKPKLEKIEGVGLGSAVCSNGSIAF